MRWTLAALFGSALVANQALAELTFTVEATKNGVPIPQSEIKLEPFEFGRTRMGGSSPTPAHRRIRRSNPTANSNNWCGSVNKTPSTNQIQVIHGTFQHPTCTQRAGVTTYPQAAANWVGIDGDSWKSALLQAGTVCKVCSSLKKTSLDVKLTSSLRLITRPVSSGTPHNISQSPKCTIH